MAEESLGHLRILCTTRTSGNKMCLIKTEGRFIEIEIIHTICILRNKCEWEIIKQVSKDSGDLPMEERKYFNKEQEI